MTDSVIVYKDTIDGHLAAYILSEFAEDLKDAVLVPWKNYGEEIEPGTYMKSVPQECFEHCQVVLVGVVVGGFATMKDLATLRDLVWLDNINYRFSNIVGTSPGVRDSSKALCELARDWVENAQHTKVIGPPITRVADFVMKRSTESAAFNLGLQFFETDPKFEKGRLLWRYIYERMPEIERVGELLVEKQRRQREKLAYFLERNKKEAADA